MTVSLVLMIVALVLFILATAGWPTAPVGLGWLGLFFYVLAQLVGKL